MQKQRLFLFLYILAFGLLVSVPAEVLATDMTCHATANGGGRVFSADSTYAIHRAAQQTFNTDGIVRVAGYCPGNLLINDRTFIMRGGYSPTDWTVSDPEQYPTIIEATQQLSVIRISAPDDTLVFENMTLTGGSAFRGGGIQVNDVLSLTLRDVTLHNNHAVEYGGGLFVAGGDVYVVRSHIYENSSDLYGGGIYSNESVTVVDSTIADNRASEFGGGLYNSGDGQLTIKNTTLARNTVTSSVSGGGGIFNRGSLMMMNSTVSGNSAESLTRRTLGTGGGGGLWNNGGMASLVHTTFANNRADNNGGYEFGGAVFNNQDGTLKLTRNLFADNIGGGCINQATITTNTSNADEDGSCDVSIVGQLDLPPLADNGGATQTHALNATHAAVDVMGETCLATDQRGVARKNDVQCDVGAYELNESSPTAIGLEQISTRPVSAFVPLFSLLLVSATGFSIAVLVRQRS